MCQRYSLLGLVTAAWPRKEPAQDFRRIKYVLATVPARRRDESKKKDLTLNGLGRLVGDKNHHYRR